MNRVITARLWAAMFVILGSLEFASAQTVTVTSPQQLKVNDTYQLNPDGFSGGEETTCPKIDLNDGAGGDNPYYQRTNVARAWPFGCAAPYWYSSSFQMTCADDPPVNTCGDGPCIDEPHPSDPQYVDYVPPFGAGANELTPGRYRIVGEYRNTTARANYPAEYIVNHVGGTTTVLQLQTEGAVNSCPTFEIGIFDMDTGSNVRVNDTGTGSITFNRMRFTLVAGLGGTPLVHAGNDRAVILPNAVFLAGQAGPEGVPTTWSQVSGPGTVDFDDASELSTTAEFSEPGVYVLRLTADDGVNVVSDDLTVTVHPESALAGVLVPTNDTYLDQTASNTVRNGDGILIKGQTGFQRIGIVEFNLPNEQVTEAKLNVLHIRSWTGLTWRLQFEGKQASFDENTITWSNASGITIGGDILGDIQMVGANDGPNVTPPQWREIDITDFFNDNRGTTVTLILRNTNDHPDRGGRLEDREGSWTGDPTNGPHISFTSICNTPFADADGDGDVDQDDFALFQLCMSDFETDEYCGCFDRDGNGSVDVFDFSDFADCATGPTVQWSQALTPNCDP